MSQTAEPTLDLMPCAFCGGEGVFTERPLGWRVECRERFAQCPMNARTHHCKEKASAAVTWNTRSLRAVAPDTAAERDRLKVADAELVKVLEKIMAGVQAMSEGHLPPVHEWQEVWDETRAAIARSKELTP